MPTTMIERPEFVEGQILGADDLTSLEKYGRDQDARHARHAHSWGIAYGLGASLDGEEIHVGPGLAIDSSGAARILAADRFLKVEDFRQDVSPAQGETQFPLFLVGQAPRSTSRGAAGRCGATTGLRVQEVPLLQFRRGTELLDWETRQDPPAVTEGPDDRVQKDRPILLGVMTWDPVKQAFKSFDDARVGRPGVRRRYLGVRADSVESIGGRLMLRTAAAKTRDAPLLRIDPAAPDGFPLAFGLDDGNGEVNPLFQVNAKGDVKAAGKIGGAAEVKKGDVHVQSGQVADGLRVPLPPSITDDMVRGGVVTLHMQVTPRPELSEQPADANFMPRVRDFAVGDDRVVRCLMRWFDTTKPTTGAVNLPGVCDYLILAKVTADPGASS